MLGPFIKDLGEVVLFSKVSKVVVQLRRVSKIECWLKKILFTVC